MRNTETFDLKATRLLEMESGAAEVALVEGAPADGPNICSTKEYRHRMTYRYIKTLTRIHTYK